MVKALLLQPRILHHLLLLSPVPLSTFEKALLLNSNFQFKCAISCWGPDRYYDSCMHKNVISFTPRTCKENKSFPFYRMAVIEIHSGVFINHSFVCSFCFHKSLEICLLT